MASDLPRRVWLWGAHRRSGHYLWGPGFRSAPRDLCSHISASVGRHIDESWCPGVRERKPRWQAPRGAQIEGHAALVQRGGWSGLCWWDRSVDPRHGSNVGIWADGTWDATALLSAGRRDFPSAFDRFAYEIEVVHEW